MKKLMMVLALLPLMAAADDLYEYIENDDGTITLMRYRGTSIPEHLEIPSECDGKKVTGVGYLQLRTQEEWDRYDGVSFFGLDEDEEIVIGNTLKSVKLPEGLKSIGSNSPFAFQSGISSVEFPSTLVTVGDFAFCCCMGLKSVDLSGTAVKSCLWSAFAGCKSLESVKFPSSLAELGGISFAWCTSLRSVTFEGGIPQIQGSATDGGDRKKWLPYADNIYVDSDFDFKDFSTQTRNKRLLGGVVTYVEHEKGWDAIAGSGVWQGRPILYVGESISKVPLVAFPGETVLFDTWHVGYTASGLPSGLKYDKTTGRITGAAKTTTAEEGVVVTFKKSGVPDETLTIVVRAEEISIGCAELSSGPLPAGVAGAANGIALQLATETDVKSVSVSKLPAGMKYDAKKGVITGAPTKAGSYEVSVTVTSKAGNKKTEKILVTVAAMPETAVGKFDGFVSVGGDSHGTFTLTTTDAGKLTAKVVTASGTVSFSGTCWDSVEDGVYRATLTTKKKGETLTLALDSTAAWDANQLTGAFSPPNMAGWFDVSAQRNAFAQKWYFDATGNANDGWSFSFAQNAKAAALTVTLKADGSTAIAGALPNSFDAKNKPASIKVSASGYANVGAVRNGAIRAGFVPVVKVGSEKKALSISTNLWFDRADNHEGGAGSAVLAD